MITFTFFDIRISMFSRHIMHVCLTTTGGIGAAAYSTCSILGPMQEHETAAQLKSNFWSHTAYLLVLDPPATDRAH